MLTICRRCWAIVAYDSKAGKQIHPEDKISGIDKTKLPLGECPDCELFFMLEQDAILNDTREKRCACGRPAEYNSYQCEVCRRVKIQKKIQEIRHKFCGPIDNYKSGKDRAIPDD
jgi:hypothetical protein